MGEVYGALAPVFLLIALGWGVRAAGVLSGETLAAVNRFGYFILLPAFLFSIVTASNFSNADAGPFLLTVLCGFALMMGLALVLRPLFRSDGPAFTSVFQGAVRWNGFPLLAAATALYGPRGLDLIGIVYGPLVFAINMVTVVVMLRWGAGGGVGWRALRDQIAANPLILACAAGLGAQALGWTKLGPVSDTLRLLGQAAMPVALICVGAGLDFDSLRADAARIATASALKLLVAPALMLVLAHWLQLSPTATAVAVGVAATPTAAAGYMLAREMGGDARLMAAIITATTLISFLTMPLAIAVALR